ncbi:MAG: hypothetical protein WBN42_09955 [Ignavibacteriaceae bacterium]
MPIPNFDSVGDAVTFNNAKAFGDAGAHLAVQAAQQFGAHNSRMNTLSESTQAMWANRMASADPVEAISVQKLMSGRDSQGIAETIALAQVLTKQAQTTPPVTA